MKKITFLSLALFLAGFTINAQSTSFEASEGFTLGNLSGQNSWTVFSTYPSIPVVTDSEASEGSNSIHLIGTNNPGNAGAFSPVFASNQDVVITVDMYVGSATNASDVDFLTQSPSQALLTSRVKFSFDNTVQILDDDGTGTVAFATTTATVIRDAWFELKMEFSFSTSEIFYYIDDTLIYTGTVFGGTNVEQMLAIFDNFESDAYFDNIVYEDGFILSVEDNKIVDNNITLFPNPTSGDINLNFAKNLGNTTIDIVNLVGQTVLSTSVNGFGKNTINTNDLASGVYLARIATEIGTTTIKFIKR